MGEDAVVPKPDIQSQASVTIGRLELYFMVNHSTQVALSENKIITPGKRKVYSTRRKTLGVADSTLSQAGPQVQRFHQSHFEDMFSTQL